MINIQMTSLEIAELTGKKHFHVLRDIRSKLLPHIAFRDESKNGGILFTVTESTYKDSYNRDKELFVLNKHSVNALMANYKIEHAMLIIEHMVNLEEQLARKEEELLIMKSLVWKVINEKSYLSREYALKSAGITHPRLFMKYLRSNNTFYKITQEKGYLKHQHVSPSDKVEMFTKEGFKWLLESRTKANTWVEEQKVLWKNTKQTF